MPRNRIIDEFLIVVQPYKRTFELWKPNDDPMKTQKNEWTIGAAMKNKRTTITGTSKVR